MLFVKHNDMNPEYNENKKEEFWFFSAAASIKCSIGGLW